MYEYDEECLNTFLRLQSQLFDEPVAETPEEAEAFLEDCMAVVADSLEEVCQFLKRKDWTQKECLRKKSKMRRKCLRCRTEDI